MAAEHKHSVTARVLLEEGAPAGVTDDSGMSALVPLIRTMPGVVSIHNVSIILVFSLDGREVFIRYVETRTGEPNENRVSGVLIGSANTWLTRVPSQ